MNVDKSHNKSACVCVYLYVPRCSYSHTHHLLWAGQNGFQPVPNNLHMGFSYHLHSSHRFLYKQNQ